MLIVLTVLCVILLFRNNWVYYQMMNRNTWIYETRMRLFEEDPETYVKLVSYDEMDPISYHKLMFMIWAWNPKTIWSWDYRDFIRKS